MFEFLFVIFLIWLLWGFVKFSFTVAWGIFKLLGILLAVVAFPMALILLVVSGLGIVLAGPVLLIMLAFGFLKVA